MAEDLEKEIQALGSELSKLADKERASPTFHTEKERMGLDKRLTQIREDRKQAAEERAILQQDIGRLNIQKAKFEARMDNLKLQVPKKKDIPYDRPVAELRALEKGAMDRLQEIGAVNMKAINEYDAIVGEFEEFKEKVDTIAKERSDIQSSLTIIEEKRLATFMDTMNSIAKNFKNVYKELADGDAEIMLEDPKDITTGLEIRATPPGKKLLSIDTMSGGEKTITAFAFLFALQKHKPSPFYILDEADATLDKVNTARVVSLLQKQSKNAQFIVISHNDTLVRGADQIYGVTMESGESKVMGIELPER